MLTYIYKNQIGNEIFKDIDKYELARNECLGSFYGSNDFEKVMENLKYGKEKETHMYLSKIKQLNNNEGTINNAFFILFILCFVNQ